MSQSRMKQYTQAQLKRGKCEVSGCDTPARYQWSICSDGNCWRMMCSEHDLELNQMVMRWAGFPDGEAKLTKYAKRVKKEKW